MWIGLDLWNTNSKKWLEGNFNKLDGNEIKSKITELIKNFNTDLSRGLKDRHWEEITKKTGINQTPHEGFTFQNILDQGMIKHLEICSEVGEKAYRK